MKRPTNPPANLPASSLAKTTRESAVFQVRKFAFGEPEKQSDVYLAYIDGASRGNPGPASYAVMLRAPDGKTKFQIGKYLGRATNNVAEYYALITALDYAAAEGIARLRVRSDSELLVRQMQGRYKVKSADLRPLHERAQKLARGLAFFAIEHVPREQNKEADELANIALDQTSSRDTSRDTREIGESRRVAAPAAPSGSASPKVPPASASAGNNAAAAVAPRPLARIRARYSAGALHPLEALDLARRRYRGNQRQENETAAEAITLGNYRRKRGCILERQTKRKHTLAGVKN